MSIGKTLLILALLTLVCAAATDSSGKWSGSAPDSPSVPTMFAVLQQDGDKLAGSAGPSEARQFPITAGKVDGDHLTFEVHMAGGTIRFDLTSTATELRGAAQLLEDDEHTDKAAVIFKRIPQ
jgi:hypothetical protein